MESPTFGFNSFRLSECVEDQYTVKLPPLLIQRHDVSFGQISSNEANHIFGFTGNIGGTYPQSMTVIFVLYHQISDEAS